VEELIPELKELKAIRYNKGKPRIGLVPPELMVEVAKVLTFGAEKYEENNWKKGIPCKCFVDSALRHFFKFIANHKDEDHESAFYWNIMCCIWTHENIPEMQSYKKEVD